MAHNLPAFLLTITLLVGCATKPTVALAPVQIPVFPADAFITQRAILTTHGRQFVLNGYLSKSATGGLRLLVTESFGQVLADVLIKSDGKVVVFRANRPLKPAWVRNYLASDLRCIFGGKPEKDCPLSMPAPDEFIISRRWYTLDLRIVSVQTGPQSPDKFIENPSSSP